MIYRYKCVISQAFYDKHTADKQAFYDTVSEIKRRHPDCREIITKNKNSERTEQVLEVEKGVKICVRIDFPAAEVAAFSSSAEVLDGLGETAERIKISPHFRDGIAFRTLLSLIFCAVNIALVYIAVRYNYWVILPICWVLLFILYLRNR